MNTRGWFPMIALSQAAAALLVCSLGTPSNANAQHMQAVRQFIEGSPAAKPTDPIQIRGVVTALWGDRAFFVQDDTGGLFAFTEGTDASLQVHDSVLLTGTPANGGTTRHLRVSKVEILGRGVTPLPIELLPETPPTNALDARLVRVRGKVSGHVAPQSQRMTIEALGYEIPVEYAGKTEPTRWPSANAEDIVNVTGALSVRGPGDSSPHPFRIIVGSRNDVLFVSGPPWWKRVQSREVAIVGALLAGVALGWGLLLRRQVRGQNAEIQTRFERESALERRYRELVENATDVVLTHDLDGRITSINPAATELLGWRDIEVVGKPIEELMAPGETHIAGGLVRPETINAPQGGRTFRLFLKTRDGRSVPFEVNSWIEYHDGAPVGVQAICRDIRERLCGEAEKANLELKLRDKQKLESLGILAGGIAHDFNNLLTAVIGNANLARLETSPNSRVQKSLEEIEHAAERAAELCSQMLAYAGQGRMVLSRVNLSALALETVDLLQASLSKRARLDLQLTEQLPPVQGDAAQLRQILVNLVINASEALGEGDGTVTVRTSTVRAEPAWVTDAQVVPEVWEGDHVLLEISDTGSGMNAETINRIFDPFFSTKFTGRGLGLAAVLGIVRGHRGALKVTSVLGQGSNFQMALPAIGVPREESGDAGAARTLPLLQGTVLVVDDEESVRRTVGRSLERLGCKVLVAEDGLVAVDRIRTSARPIDLVLLDLTMPKMDGVQTLRELRRLRPDLPIILMSGFAAAQALARFGEHHLSGFLQKPFTMRQLRGLAEPILERSPELGLAY